MPPHFAYRVGERDLVRTNLTYYECEELCDEHEALCLLAFHHRATQTCYLKFSNQVHECILSKTLMHYSPADGIMRRRQQRFSACSTHRMLVQRKLDVGGRR